MGTILDRIVETKRQEVAEAKAHRPLSELQAACRDVEPPQDFYGAIAAGSPRGMALIAEIKRKSPSAGLIREDFDPAALARIYHEHGAQALSVLTDAPYFDGRLEFLEQVKAAVPLPVLRKDFMIDAYQIVESRVAGADCVLLIGEVLAAKDVLAMIELAHELGMTALVEVHEPETLEALLEVIPFPNPYRMLLGVNNRNLKIQQTDITHTHRLASRFPAEVLLVSESGIKTPEDVHSLKSAGAKAVLIGETFMKAPDVGAKVDEIMGRVE